VERDLHGRGWTPIAPVEITRVKARSWRSGMVSRKRIIRPEILNMICATPRSCA
jgi:hypothetical protein